MAVAVASLQESVERVNLGNDDDSGPPASMSLQQCNLGIQELIASAQETTPIEIMLTTCILLIWFELLRANPQASSRYLQLGLGMLQRPKAELLNLVADAKAQWMVEGEHSILKAVLAKITATAEYTGWGMHTWQKQNRVDLDDFDNQLPSTVENLIEIWTYGEILQTFCIRALRNLSNRTHMVLTTAFTKALDQKLFCLVEGYERLDGANNQFAAPQIETLSSLFNMLQIMIRCSITANDELAYDKYDSQFKEIVLALRTGCQQLALISPGEDRLSVLPFCIWAVPRLYFVATNCRDPSIRREAIQILSTYRRREASLDSWTAAKLAEAKMQIEEKGVDKIRSSSDIPASNRIRIHDASYDAATRQVVLRYIHAPYDEINCAIEETRIDWAKKINDIALDDAEMVNELLQVHGLFLKAGTSQARGGVVEPMYYHGELVDTVEDCARAVNA